MDKKQCDELVRFIFSTDEEFYETHLKDLSEEQLEHFLNENPDFLIK